MYRIAFTDKHYPGIGTFMASCKHFACDYFVSIKSVWLATLVKKLSNSSAATILLVFFWCYSLIEGNEDSTALHTVSDGERTAHIRHPGLASLPCQFWRGGVLPSKNIYYNIPRGTIRYCCWWNYDYMFTSL